MPENIDKTNKTEKKSSTVGTLFILYLITFATVLLSVCGVFAIVLNSQRIAAFFQRDSYTYQLGSDKEKDTVKRTVPASQLYFDGVLYFSMDDIASLCKLTVTGDYSKRTYFPSDDDTQYVTFFYSSDKIIINGETTTMKDVMFEKDGAVYVPASFFYNFSSGININVDPEKYKITVSRISLETVYNALDEEEYIYQNISFMSGSSNELEHLNNKEVFANTSPVVPPEDETGDTQGGQNADNTNNSQNNAGQGNTAQPNNTADQPNSNT